MILVEYNLTTLEVEGLFTEEQRTENTEYIEITEDEELELLKLNQKGTLFVKNKETKEFEAKQVKLPIVVISQANLNAQLLKQNAELKTEVEKQKVLNSQVLSELAELKGVN